jgi:CheY-like chemotaxis protein
MQIACLWRPDAVFLEIELPGKGGYALARQLRTEADLCDALIVLISEYLDDDARRTASGIDAHLLKPTSIEDLQDLMAAWLNGDSHDAITVRGCPAPGPS